MNDKKISLEPSALSSLYTEISSVIEKGRNAVYRAANFGMVQTYWHVGRIIVEFEQNGKNRAQYGDYVLQKLSERLTKKFGRGYDDRNLRYMRQFYLFFPIRNALRSELNQGKNVAQIVNAVRSKSTPVIHAVFDEFDLSKILKPELTWTHYRLLLKVENEEARKYYMKEAVEGSWATRHLERQINSFYYERVVASKNRKAVQKECKDKKTCTTPKDLIKDPYILEFLELRENTKYLEHELESALLKKIQEFLLELGKGFCFVARQKRISTETEHFYIDLVFYNYILKCFLLIDLKTTKLTHQDIGQMDMYVRMFEDLVKPKEDNPTIGLILCTEKDEAVVKYSVLKENKQLFASKYKLYLPSIAELKKELEDEAEQLKTEKRLEK